MKKSMIAFSAALLVVAISPASQAMSGRLWPDYYLFRGQYQYEPTNCYYRLEMQDDGNLVTYAGPGYSNPIWWTSTHTLAERTCEGDLLLGCNGFECDKGMYAAMQRDGNFVVYNRYANCMWATMVFNYNLPGELIQQVDGNLVVYDAYSQPVWWSGQVRPQFSATCPSPRGKKTLVSNNLDRPGGDYSFHLVEAQPSICGDMCAHDSRCKAWTYVPRNGYAECWLKDSMPALSSREGVVSGAIIIDP